MAIDDSKISTSPVVDNPSCFIRVGELTTSTNALCRHVGEAENKIKGLKDELKERNLNGCEHSRKVADKMQQINNFKRMTFIQVVCVLSLIVGWAVNYGKSQESYRHLNDQVASIQADVKENHTLLVTVREKQIEVRNKLDLKPR